MLCWLTLINTNLFGDETFCNSYCFLLENVAKVSHTGNGSPVLSQKKCKRS